MKMRLPHHFCTVCIVMAIASRTQGAPSEEPEPETKDQERKVVAQKAEDLVKLPEPLTYVSGNLLDLEMKGFFKIVKGEYGRVRELDEEALIWTLEVVKPITCRHATILLRRLSDVRFYWIDKKWQKQLHSTDLWYSSWVASGSVHHEILDPYERFQVWVLLDAEQVRRLKHERANRVVFKVPKRRRGYGTPVLPKSIVRWTR
jgi:hypothetical protein